jgi:hypothetical protein
MRLTGAVPDRSIARWAIVRLDGQPLPYPALEVDEDAGEVLVLARYPNGRVIVANGHATTERLRGQVQISMPVTAPTYAHQAYVARRAAEQPHG